jgi:predicted amidohydrolase
LGKYISSLLLMLNSKTLKSFVLWAIIALASALTLCACGKNSDGQQEIAPAGHVRVAGIILRWVPGDREANMSRAEKLIRRAADKGARIICTPESFLDGYSVRDRALSREAFRALAEEVPGGRYFSRLQRISDECDVYLIVGLTEGAGDTVYNSAALIGPDGALLGMHRKNFLWYTETDQYTAGQGFPALVTEFGRIGMMICSERRQPEAVAKLAENGADLVFCLAGGGYGDASDAIVSQRSSEGHVPIVFVHPLEFLVTGRDGGVLTRSVLGDDLDGQPGDGLAGEIRYYDLAVMPDTGAGD